MILLFDLDNTLINRDLAYRQWLMNLLAEFNIDVKSLDEVLEKDDSGYTARKTFFSFLFNKFSLPLNVEQLLDKSINELHQYILPIRQDIKELLLDLSIKFTLGILTNGGVKNQRAKIKASKLDEYISKEHIFISADLGFEKPDINCFQSVEKQLNVKSSEIMLVGDHPINDIEGAKSAGWQTVWINHGRNLVVDADRNISGLTELKALL